MFISEKIKEEYQSWNAEKPIFISSPTGTGKTSFIFDTLLPYMIANRKKILYLVNRSVLKKQLLKRCANLQLENQIYIHIETYQKIEELLQENSKVSGYKEYNCGLSAANPSNTAAAVTAIGYSFERINNPYLIKLASYDCVVCDEAHYFLSDSNFNTNTYLSYLFVQRCYANKLKIFISATIDKFREYVCDGTPVNFRGRSKWFSLFYENAESLFRGYQSSPLKYTGDKDYSYVCPHFIMDERQIPECIIEKKGKWLVFVDNKNTGKMIKNQIIKHNKEVKKRELTVSFVTADYYEDEETWSQVESIVNLERQKADVLIATSVLDNGVNLADNDLRNIVIMADNETELIQMLGRRRNLKRPADKIDVYFYMYGKGHFARRVNDINNKKKYAEKFYLKVLNMVQGLYPTQDINSQEQVLVMDHTREIMRSFPDIYDKIRNTHLSFDGIFCLNPLSLRNYINLNIFYKKMFEYCDADPNAFAKEVFEWLNLQMDDFEIAISNTYERIRASVIKKIEEKINKPMKNVDDNVDDINDEKKGPKAFKNSLQSEMIQLIKLKSDKMTEKEYDSLKKHFESNDRQLTDNMMKIMNKIFDFNYIVINKDGQQIILHIDEKN